MFTGTIKEIEKITGKTYNYSDSKQDVSFRVIADHIRAIAFTIADGQLPSNTGAGYVIRRILRRAVRYYYSYLDYKQPLLFQLMPLLAKQFENVFPELQQQVDFVSRVVKEEEEAFLRTLGKGLQLFYNLTKEPITTIRSESKEDFLEKMTLKNSYSHVIEKKIIPGIFAFKLTDTYGFPIDLTQLLATEEGWTIEMQEFDEFLQQQKNRSRAATTIDTEDWIVVNDGNKTEFIGYDNLETKSSILKYRKVKSKDKEAYQIVLNKTPFYAESGGQVGDQGVLIPLSTRGEGQGVRVIDTKKENDLIIHVTENIPDELSGEVTAIVPTERRHRIASHHSATHLLHAALRQVLGMHVAQKGSLVNEEQLRFDFSHFAKVTSEEIAQVESIVNRKIRQNIPVVVTLMSKEDAMQTGAMALFGEKYGDVVRVVTIDPTYSVELCGGTHIGATGELGFFKIKTETAVAAGVRRMEAVTGKVAENYINEQLADLNRAKTALKNPAQLNKSIENLLAEQSEVKKKLESFEARLLNSLEDELMQKITIINNISFIGETVDVSNADSLKKLSIDLSKKINGIVVLCASLNNKASVAVALAESLTIKGFDANKIIKEQVAHLIKGGGGGNKTAATAGGQDSTHFREVIEKIKSLL